MESVPCMVKVDEWGSGAYLCIAAAFRDDGKMPEKFRGDDEFHHRYGVMVEVGEGVDVPRFEKLVVAMVDDLRSTASNEHELSIDVDLPDVQRRAAILAQRNGWLSDEPAL